MQSDPVSEYLFVLALESYFIMIKSNTNIHRINIFDNDFICTAYAGDTTFFLKDLDSIKNVLGMLDKLYVVTGNNLNRFAERYKDGTQWTEKFRFNQREH